MFLQYPYECQTSRYPEIRDPTPLVASPFVRGAVPLDVVIGSSSLKSWLTFVDIRFQTPGFKTNKDEGIFM